jgi:hypothetical protein
MSGAKVMQADTIDIEPKPRANAQIQMDAQSNARFSGSLEGNGDYSATFWRTLPVLFGAAAYLPQIWSSLVAVSSAPLLPGIANGGGGLLEAKISGLLGGDGLALFGAAIAGLIAYGVWALARGVGAPRWAAALVASISLVAPLFGLAPSPAIAPDDALFGAFMTLAIAAVVWAGRREDSNCLMVAFILAIVAALLRPGAIWPAVAIGLAALASTNKLEEGPIVGMLSSLCWAPGLFFAHKIFGSDDNSTITNASSSILETARELAATNLSAADNAAMSLPAIVSGLLSGIPFVLFGLTALAGCIVLFLLGKGRRRGAIAGGVAMVISALGAAGYGDFDAAKLLMEPIFLGLGASLGLVLPSLIDRIKTAHAAQRVPTAPA